PMPKSLILCDCSDTSNVHPDALDGVEGVTCSKVHTGLCTHQSEAAAKAISAGDAIIACQQERAFFTELAADLDVPEPQFVDIRDRAGWSDEAAKSGPKQATLLADAMRAAPPVKTFDIVSEGLCLILGPTEAALSAAADLKDHLNVTVLLENTEDAPIDRGFDVVAGRLKSAQGALGGFTVTFDALQQLLPSGRGPLSFSAPQNGARTECDVILDLRRDPPLFPAHEKREGYLRADPASAPALRTAILEASHLVGTFEKPFFLALDPTICAHSRAEQTGCSKCLDNCPTSAIRPEGDHIDIDPNICAGCGSCAALCPSGAITYDDPPTSFLFARIAGLADAYRNAGGVAPRLLVHDRDFGADMISLAARFDRGLPAAVIPMDLERVSGFGHAEMLAAMACGFSGVDILVAPKTDRSALDTELPLAQALSGHPDALRILEPAEPSQLCDALNSSTPYSAEIEPILPLGTRRQVTRLAVKTLQPNLDAPLPLPENAPYGAVVVD
ncbi:MAG: 4Fe-4S dicluster domain-containing protein, partial [Shimia sp.]|nr:4Fe-4S dicluster domain-containing protein [Shimia sp.]